MGSTSHLHLATHKATWTAGKKESSLEHDHPENKSHKFNFLFSFCRCRKHINPQTSPLGVNETCFALTTYAIQAQYAGYTVWNKCPQNWTERDVHQKCQDEDYSDLLRNLPVFNEDSLVTYKNATSA